MVEKKLYIGNFIAYGFINVLNRIIPFLMLPVVTRLLPNTSDFGVYSIYKTILGFGTPFAILGLYDAMFREYFEKDDMNYKHNVTTTAQRLVLFSSIIVAGVLIIFSSPLSRLFFSSGEQSLVVALAGLGVFIGANKSPIAAPTRMQNQRTIYIVTGLISAIILYVIAIVPIRLDFGFMGLVYGSIVSSAMLLAFFAIRNRRLFLLGKF